MRRPIPPGFIDELQAALPGRVSLNPTELERHGRDESSLPEAAPDAVVMARSTDDVSALLRLCHEAKVPVVPFGVGSSLEGHVLPVHGGISLDLSEMDTFIDVRPDDLLVVVQAGVRRVPLNERLARDGLFFSVDPGADATLGGMAATGASGTTTVRYGSMRDNVLALTAVLADGTVIAGASTEHDGWRVHFERSDDGGRTFVAGPPVNVSPRTKREPPPAGTPREQLIDAIQPSVLDLGGGRLLAVGRTMQGRVFEVESRDAGRTWGAMRLGELPTPSSGTDAVTLADGRHLIVYNHTKSAARTPLDVAISRDGTTWMPVVALETMSGSFAYPAVIQSSDGLVHVTYTWNRQTIVHVVLDPAKLGG